MISIIFKNMYMIPKISNGIKIRVYENMQNCSLVFLGHLRLLTGRFSWYEALAILINFNEYKQNSGFQC